MDNDKKQIPLNSYFEDAITKAGSQDFDVQSFLTGLDAYGILPEDVTSIVAQLHTGDITQQPELIKELRRIVQTPPEAPEGSQLPQFSESSEIQSSLPVAPISEGRNQAQQDLGEYISYQHAQRSDYLKGNIEWRRKVAQDFITRLRNERLYGGGPEADSKAQEIIEKTLENPIYAKTQEEAAKKLAEKISYDELFAKNRAKAREIIEAAAKEKPQDAGVKSVIEELVDIPTTYAVEAVLQNRTLEDVRPVLNQYAAISRSIDKTSAKDIETAATKAKIYASVSAKSSPNMAADTKTVQEFNSSIRAIQQNPVHKKRLEEKIAVDDYGRSIVEKGEADEFIKRSEKYSGRDIKGKVTEFMAPAYTPDDMTLEYFAAEVRHDPTGTATPHGLHKAVSHPTHVEFHMPDLSWIITPGKKKAGTTIAGAVVKKKLSDKAKELGTSFLLKLGVGAGSKVMLAGAPVVGWVILLATTFSGTIKTVVVSTTNKLLNGGLGSVRAANGAFSEFIQNALGTTYNDPLAPNGWLLALGMAILPFLLAFLFTTATFETQRAQFIPIASGIATGGTPIDCTQEPDKSGPACNLTKCVVKKPGDCQWPLEKTSGACIIEGPFVGTHSSCRLSGVDFISRDADQAGLFGAKVFTPYAGTVEEAVFGYDDYSGREGSQDGGTYGNHVIVKTNDGGRLMFAHLRNIQTVNTGDSVESGTVVGFVDSTGYSLGVHLHYEELGPSRSCPRSGADINKYTPFPVPPCEGFADCDAKLKAAGYAACLSEMP